MKNIILSDTTLKLYAEKFESPLTFKKKLEIASKLDELGIPIIELGKFSDNTEDLLLIKALAEQCANSKIAFSLNIENPVNANVKTLVDSYKNIRLQLCASLSTSRMEYVYHKKATDMIATLEKSIKECLKVSNDVEVIIEDATLVDVDFLSGVISAIVNAGTKTITLSDPTGSMLPDEIDSFINNVATKAQEVKNVSIGFATTNGFGLADATAIKVINGLVSELKVSIFQNDSISLSKVVHILDTRKEMFNQGTSIHMSSFDNVVDKITNICFVEKDDKSPFENGVINNTCDITFSSSTKSDELFNEISILGYDLSDNDKDLVWNAFQKAVSEKGNISTRELEVIISTNSLLVPETYKLDNFTVTTGNSIDIVAHVKLTKDKKSLSGVALGNGPIDAAFLAIENITGCHYELDDFQIQAVSEGNSAMGQTFVRLRSNGKIYSGSGISTDIICSAILSYISALNKIVYEEENI